MAGDVWGGVLESNTGGGIEGGRAGGGGGGEGGTICTTR
tara:strand:+ start:1138 stop:1254 length:117 start_codon:yes stop_codon:yes gene_type:complete